MERASIKVTHEGVEITYDELTNQWVFELRGRERKVASLKVAKEAIDKPEPVTKAPFKRTMAFIENNSWQDAGFSKVEVTSVTAESRYETHPHLWVVYPNGERKKVSSRSVIENTPENIARMKAWKVTAVEIDERENQQKILLEQMTLFPVTTNG
jgi:hypothetical protein